MSVKHGRRFHTPLLRQDPSREACGSSSATICSAQPQTLIQPATPPATKESTPTLHTAKVQLGAYMFGSLGLRSQASPSSCELECLPTRPQSRKELVRDATPLLKPLRTPMLGSRPSPPDKSSGLSFQSGLGLGHPPRD